MADIAAPAARMKPSETVFPIILAVSFCHMLNDVMQSLLAALLGMIVLWQVGAWYSRYQAAAAKRPRPPELAKLPRKTVVVALVVLAMLTFTKNIYTASISSYYTFYTIEKFGITVQTSQVLLFVFLGAAALGTVLGGPIGAYQIDRYPFLADELRLIERRVAADKPLLGVCLGAQLLATACGASVSRMGRKEIGFAPLALTEAGRTSPLAALDNLPVLHWHGDQFDLPEGATLLASSEQCPHQAFSIGDRILGLQFHAETDCRTLENWLVGHASELAQAGFDVAAIREDAVRHGPSLANAGREMLATWLKDSI